LLTMEFLQLGRQFVAGGAVRAGKDHEHALAANLYQGEFATAI
jgi:hypothetical protein